MGKKVIPIRASSLGELVDCQARWKATQLDGLSTPAKVATWLGQSLHKSLEVYDKSRMNSVDSMRIEDVQGLFTHTLWHPDEEVVGEEDEFRKAEKNGLELVRKYTEVIAPERKYVAVEVTCPKLDVEVEGIVIRLSGTVDRIRQAVNGGYGVSDLKSGEQAVRADNSVVVDPHRPQVGVYELLASAVTGKEMTEPAEIIGLGANGKARVAAGEVRNAAELLVGTEKEPGLLQYAARIVKNEVWMGNPRSLLCGPAYCPIHAKCRFRGV